MPTVHPSLLERKIIHFDMDAFYASIEIRDDPSLKDKPLVIGGSPQSRAVVCTASYVARKFGVRSAMPCSQAARLCPDAVFMAPNFYKYKAVSQQIRDIFQQYTSLIEPLSLDEAYLDVTHNERGLYATKLAKLIQDQIYDELKLTGSAGIAPNKLLAKIASDINKPRGLTVILPEQARRFMEHLPLRRIHGVGPASEKRLQQAGLVYCRDVWQRDPAELERQLGSMGRWIWVRSQGIDERPVEVERERKSLGKEDTFATDILDPDVLVKELRALAAAVADALQRRGLRGKTITVKCKYADFNQVTRSRSLTAPTDEAVVIQEIACDLLGQTEVGKRKVRLLGVSVANFEQPEALPLGLQA
ncbi:DNA polymerase IV [Oligoflexus tunisiensis]|uniref:DNA polymerase IV n=1 Tax=Oligoflexus tunisiensis TaxID=708132 RepID=UPI000B336B01|nr:DNA polymerase IV [Oligoflexus tunisiensis]